MRPSFSIIFFTVVSGCGFGLLFLVGAILCIAPETLSRNAALGALALGVVFAGAGLLSSMLHLGQPLRAWRALSQWRSSWLSREGVASLATFVPAAILFLLVWNDSGSRIVAVLLAVFSAITVICTSGIYTSLKTIRAWSNAWTLPSYLSLAAASAACGFWLVASSPFSAWLVVVLCAIGACIKIGYWRFIDNYAGASTPESATGLGSFGTVRTFEAPHTEDNYLTREMGFVLARKHASKLRTISLVLFAIVPVACAILSLLAGSPLPFAATAAVSAIAGLFIERWLFFAQAKHKVMLFYARYSAA